MSQPNLLPALTTQLTTSLPTPPQLKGLLSSAQEASAGSHHSSTPEYFMAVLPGGVRLVRPIARGERWPLNLGREVLAKLAGVPERADWKQCTRSDAETEQACEEFKGMFSEYDPAPK